MTPLRDPGRIVYIVGVEERDLWGRKLKTGMGRNKTQKHEGMDATPIQVTEGCALKTKLSASRDHKSQFSNSS